MDPMAGLGFGLPVSRLYAQYFGGNIEVRALAVTLPAVVQIVPGAEETYNLPMMLGCLLV